MSAGVGAAALLVVAVSPAGAAPFDLWPSARTQAQSRSDASNQRFAYRSRESRGSRGSRESKEKVAVKQASDDLAAKAKGPMSVIISLDKQHLTLYSGDQPIAHSRVSTGMAGHSTPKGVFSVIQKDRWHHSNIYSNAPMYYMQRITWSGVAMHQGYVPNYPASHGCIRLPEAFAKQLWGITKLGARVIIARPELTPSAISSPKLFVFKQPPAPPKPPEVAEQPTTVGISADATVKAAFNSVNAAPAVGTKANQRVTATDAPNSDPVLAAAAKPLKPGPISVFISRKEGKIFVRKGFEPVFDAPVTFAQPDQPLGTHVYTALSFNDDNSSLRWMVVTVPNAQPTAKADRNRSRRGRKTEAVVTAPEPMITSTAAEALERVTIPQDALDRIQGLMSPGASLTIADQGLGGETGKGTDFIVVTR
jgi:lipoprotein-anchoring transpeptidase ErfK/SrfK